MKNTNESGCEAYLLRLAIDIPIVGVPAVPVRPQTETLDVKLHQP